MLSTASLWKACNTTALSFVGASGIQYQYCLWRRQQEKEGMMRAVEVLNKKEVEKKARERQREKAREERRKFKEEEQDEQFAKLREEQGGGGKGWGGWKFW